MWCRTGVSAAAVRRVAVAPCVLRAVVPRAPLAVATARRTLASAASSSPLAAARAPTTAAAGRMPSLLMPARALATPSASSTKPLVPVIDLKNFKGDKSAIAAAIGRACEEIGFLSIVNHGVSPAVIEAVDRESRAYFDLPTNEKRRIPMTDTYPFGYSGFAEENLAAGYGVKRLPDLKEMFCIGPYNPEAKMPPIQWPERPAGLKAAYHDYYQSCEVLSARLLQLFALALKLPENWFEDKITRHASAMRVLNYPALKEAPPVGQIRAGEHTDYGALTILLQDKVGGLQVKSRSGAWVDIAPVPGSFVVNLGDLMARWTNDKWVSTLHRVLPPRESLARRQSIAYFSNMNEDARIECIPTCQSPGEPAKYAPVSAGAYLLQKHLASQGGPPPK